MEIDNINKTAQVVKQEPKFSIQDLIKNAALFSQTSEVMAGALHGKTAPLAKAEAQKALDDFLKKPISKEV